MNWWQQIWFAWTRAHRTYECPVCKATRTLLQSEIETREEFLEFTPPYLLCGYLGCKHHALPTDRYDDV